MLTLKVKICRFFGLRVKPGGSNSRINPYVVSETNTPVRPSEMADVSPPRMIAAMERGPGAGKYHPDLAPTRKSMPSYSFGKRAEKDISKIDDSPGPKYGIDETLTTKGAIRNPKFSLSGRNKDPIVFNTPGPGSYQVQTPFFFKGTRWIILWLFKLV